MVDYKYKDLFPKSHIDKQLKIATDDGLFTATNSDIHFEDFELTESLCSDSELRFGSCEASMVKFQIRNAFIPLAGKWLTVTETLEENVGVPFQYGRYKVFSDAPTADKEYRDIVAYDAMYDILSADVAAWYNSVLPNKDSTVTMKQFRESFIAYFDLDEVVPEGGLVNDGMTVEKTIDIIASSETDSETEQSNIIGESLSGMDVITAICEINGCFGHIGRDGKFHYIYLPQAIQGLYPADNLFPSSTLYPRDPKGEKVGGNGTYIDAQFEDFSVNSISKLQIRQEENDIGLIYGSGDNTYIIQGNFLVYGKSSDQLRTVAENIFTKISGITYIPLKHCEAMGNPCFEVGDPVRMPTKYKLIETYILERTLKGIQALRDTYKSNGVEKYTENINSVHQSILQLKGKANILTRTIEETRLEMIDMGEGLSNTISITAKELRGELKNTKEGLETQISVTAAGIRTEVSKTYETKTNASSEYTTIKSSITQNANSITAEVTRASTAEGNLSSRITITENGLTSKVTKGNISSEISQEAGQITISANRFVLNSTNCSIAADGTITAKNVNITGKIVATAGGTIGGFTIGDSSIYKTTNSMTSTSSGVYLGTDGANWGGKAKITAAGKATFSDVELGGNGKIKFVQGAFGTELNSDELTFGINSVLNVRISGTKVSCYNNYIDKDRIRAGSVTGNYAETTSSNLKVYSSPSQYIEIHSYKAVTGGTYDFYEGLTGTLRLSKIWSYLHGDTATLGATGKKISFFGSATPSNTKQTVSNITSTSSATISSVAAKLNDLLTALRSYNLIG